MNEGNRRGPARRIPVSRDIVTIAPAATHSIGSVQSTLVKCVSFNFLNPLICRVVSSSVRARSAAFGAGWWPRTLAGIANVTDHRTSPTTTFRPNLEDLVPQHPIRCIIQTIGGPALHFIRVH